MALLQIAQNENLVPTEEDIDKTLSERAERTKKTLEEIKAASNVEAIRRNEGIRRAADYVIEHSTIEENNLSCFCACTTVQRFLLFIFLS